MKIKYGFKIALTGLRTNKSRSILTILGIVIGITAIILVMSIGQGAQNLILDQIKSIGAKTLVVAPGRQPSGFMDLGTLFSDSLKQRELDALSKKTNVPRAEKIMPIVFGSVSASYKSNVYRFTVFGASDLAAKIYDAFPEKGYFFTDEDVKSRANMAVIGSKVKQELFGDSSALGEFVRIKGRNFKIVGILEQKGAGSLVNFDDSAFIPYTTAQEYLFGIKHFHRIAIEVEEEKYLDQTVEDIKITLRNLHNIDDTQKDDFFVETQADAVEMVGTITGALTMFLVAVAAISLLVGGVGIMNIMLVSVTERTREIGLRKAIGATKKDILTQFLIESVFLTSAGGIIGIFLGSLFSFLASLAISKALGSWTFIFPWGPALLGLLVSAFVGLIFGIYPARKASQKSPIEALRYE